MQFNSFSLGRWLSLIFILLLNAPTVYASSTPPEVVHFNSQDNSKTKLTGYLFTPSGGSKPYPAIVLLHGRGGVFSSAAKGVYRPSTLSKRHKLWGQRWAELGYVALLVDSFGSRGYPKGFPAKSYKDRPAEVSDQGPRQLDAYGALTYLRTRLDVKADRIAVHGWSNGAMTLLSVLSEKTPGLMNTPNIANGFRAGLAYYPSCRNQTDISYAPYAPILILIGDEDEEVSAKVCQKFIKELESRGVKSVGFKVYGGATHGFDDPSPKRSSKAENADAAKDAQRLAEEFIAEHLKK